MTTIADLRTAGRPRVHPERLQVRAFRLRPEYYEAVERQAAKAGLCMSRYIESLLDRDAPTVGTERSND